MANPEIVVIGGGTGTYTLLTGLKKHPVRLSAIISMTDSGGSNRILRDEFGLLPTSDLRQCITALADESDNHLLRQLFTYRYNLGTGISGMTFGNLFMAALTDILGSQAAAIKETCKMLGVKGRIIPVTYDNCHLVARYDHGKQILGEHFIDEPDENTGTHRIVDLYTVPDAAANPEAVEAILNADLIILGPGDLYTSVICNLVVDGISAAIRRSPARKVYVVNLMTKFGQTNNFSARDHLTALEKYLGAGTVDYCLVHHPAGFPEDLISRYREEKAEPVRFDLRRTGKPRVVTGNFVSDLVFRPVASDKLKRSLIRHDPDRLAEAIIKLV